MISICGLQFLEDETDDNIETVQQGEYFFRNGFHRRIVKLLCCLIR